MRIARLAAASCFCAAIFGVAAVSHGAPPQPVKVLLVGDSLSVGPFGSAMQSLLSRSFGEGKVCLFASCGSSPEDWLPGPVFVTKCGYRQKTPSGSQLSDYGSGGRPRAIKTPKLRTITANYNPEFVMVQLGTNWMDGLAAGGVPDADRHKKIIGDFIRELRRGQPPRAIFWVLPPASSKYPVRVHAAVERWINDSARTMGFYTINSRQITGGYRAGRSGGDGVHYSDEAGRRWAASVFRKFLSSVRTLSLAPAPAGR